MSDEAVAVLEEETSDEVEKDANPLFDTLFEAAEETEEEEVPETSHPTSLSSALHDIEYEAEETPTEPEKVEDSAPAVADAPQIAEAPKKKKVVRRKRKIVDPTPEVASPRMPSPSPEDPFVSQLNADERERYELSKWAESNLEGRDGLSDGYLSFFKKHKEYLEKRLSEDPEVDLADDREYDNFKSVHRPKITQGEINAIQDERRLSIAEDRAVQKLQPEIERLRREQHIMREKPKVTEKFTNFKAKSLRDAVPEEMRKLHATLGSEFKVQYPFEHGIVDSVLGDALKMSESFLSISSGVEDFNENDPLHKRVSDWIDSEQTAFINSGKTVRNGKTFIRRERYGQLPESEREKYYIFTDEQLLDILSMRAKQNMEGKIGQLRAQLDASGYTRGKKAPTAKSAPAPVATPKMHPTQSAGATVGAESAPEEKRMDPLALLGL